MATADLASITDALAQLFNDEVYPQMNRSAVLASMLPYKAGSGKNLAWDVEFGTAAGDGPLAEGTNVSNFNDDEVKSAILSWGDYSEAFAVTGKALAAAASAGNPAELASLFLEKLERRVRAMTKKINQDLYTGTGAASTIQGLDDTNGALNSTGTYATIDRAVDTQWAGNELRNGGVPRPLSFTLMRDAKKEAYIDSGEFVDLIVTDPHQFERYGALCDNNRRYIDNIRTAAGMIKLDGGWRALEFDGIPVVCDVDCPAGTMYFLNTNYLSLRQLPDASTSANRGAGMVQLHGTPDAMAGSGNTALSARLNLLSVAGDTYKVQLINYPQLECRKPNANAILGDLTTP